MKDFGGFLGLEVPRPGALLHDRALALASGRACLHRILRQVQPPRIHIPFYVCDAVVQACVAAGVPYEFYGIDAGLAPLGDPRGDEREVMLVVNYFGLMTSTVAGLQSPTVIVDDSQAFYRQGSKETWSFNSARKFFGVPDGAYLYGPVDSGEERLTSVTGDYRHLVSRLTGDGQEAYAEYVAHEASFTAEVRTISPLSDRLLRAVDYEGVARTRRQNFAVLDACFARMNRLERRLESSDVPLYYPLLPLRPVAHERLWQEGIFVPRLWPEVMTREGHNFADERLLAAEVLPLPVDQRYTEDDMMLLCDRMRAFPLA